MFKIGRSEVALVDFQYCNGDNNTIFVKELAYMVGNSVTPHFFLFNSPFDKRELTKETQKQNDYCKAYIHGLDWNDGDLAYTNVGNVLLPLNNFKYIFVFGSAKKDFLLKYVDSIVINIEYQTSFSNLKNYSTCCPLHKEKQYKCALNNLFKLFVFLEKNEHRIEDFYFDDVSS